MATKKTAAKTETAAKAETKKTAAKAETETTAKKTATKKTATKKAETKAVETKAVDAKAETKPAAKKTTTKKPAAKKAAKVEVFVEFAGAQVAIDEVIANVQKANGEAAKSYTIYLKPEESKAYYVADGVEKEMDVFFIG